MEKIIWIIIENNLSQYTIISRKPDAFYMKSPDVFYLF